MKRYLKQYFNNYLGEIFIENSSRNVYYIHFDNQTTFNSQIVFNPNFKNCMHNLGFSINYGDKIVTISKKTIKN